jgi:hypothetical protein
MEIALKHVSDTSQLGYCDIREMQRWTEWITYGADRVPCVLREQLGLDGRIILTL